MRMEIRVIYAHSGYYELGVGEPIAEGDMREWGRQAVSIDAGSEYIGKLRGDLPKVDWHIRRVWRKNEEQ